MRRPVIAAAALAIGIATAMLAAPSSAGAASHAVPKVWTAVKAKTPSSASGLQLANVACVGPTHCWSAGDSTNSAGADTSMIERLRHGRFTLSHSSYKHGELEGISCSSKKSCWNVGSFTGSGSSAATVPIAQHWNGKKWSRGMVVNPAGGDNFLNDVSCLSDANCYAVGGYGNDTSLTAALHPLLEHWDGTKWTRMSAPPVPRKQASEFLNAISCVSASRCVAIGASIPTGKYFDHVYSDVFNGTKWSLLKMPQPFNQQFSYAFGSDVSCPDAKTCLATGSAGGDADGQGTDSSELWRLTGGKWMLLKLPSSARKTGQGLQDVSCVSATECWAVGVRVPPGSSGIGAALRWNGGTSITVGSVKQPKKRSNQLESVGCVASGRCYALGVSQAASGPGSTVFADKIG